MNPTRSKFKKTLAVPNSSDDWYGKKLDNTAEMTIEALKSNNLTNIIEERTMHKR